jgi:hypothetical protein
MPCASGVLRGSACAPASGAAALSLTPTLALTPTNDIDAIIVTTQTQTETTKLGAVRIGGLRGEVRLRRLCQKTARFSRSTARP